MAAPGWPGIRMQPLQYQLDGKPTFGILACAVDDEAGRQISFPPETPALNCMRIERLPNELLTNIFDHINPPRPSLNLLHDEPTFDLTRSSIADLKSISQVSKRWRQAILPSLFRHAQFTVKDTVSERKTLYNQLQPFFDFLTRSKLREVVSSFVLIVHDKKIAGSPARTGHTNSVSVFWNLLFGVIDPVDLLIVAPAEALGALTSCHVMLQDVWCFDCPCQYLRLQRSATCDVNSLSIEDNVPTEVDPSNVVAHVQVEQAMTTPWASTPPPQTSSSRRTSPYSGEAIRTVGSPLFEYHPWTKLLLNEGSFIRAYATYEFWLREAPSILSDLLGNDTPPRKALISPTIRDMEYIGVFPMASHFSNLTKHCPRIDRLYIQLVPRNEILQDSHKMAQVESEDLWMERNSCYALFSRELFNIPPMRNYRHLKVFESGDAADRDAWNMAVEFVARTTGDGWKVVGDGVLAKDPVASPTDEGKSDKELVLSFDGELVRWGWNGTTILPVSAAPIYNGQANWQWN